MTKIVVAVFSLLLATGSQQAGKQTAAPSGVLLTVLTPTPAQLELAVNEVELQWRDGRGNPSTQAMLARPTRAASLKSSAAGRAVFEATGVRTLEQMRPLVAELELANPGAVAYLVLYDAGQAHTEATRQLLGREVAVIFSRDVDARTIFQNTGAANPRALTAVARAYVVDATDPANALTLAQSLRALPGVTTAYPLLQRRLVSR